MGSQGHGSYWVTGLLGYRVYYPRFLHYPYLQGHHGLGSRVTRVTGSWVTMSHHHPGLGSPWVTGSPLTLTRVTHHHGYRVTGHYGLGSQGLYGHRVTHHPGSRISHHPGYRVTITMVSGHIQPGSYHGGVLRLEPTSTPSLK